MKQVHILVTTAMVTQEVIIKDHGVANVTDPIEEPGTDLANNVKVYPNIYKCGGETT